MDVPQREEEVEGGEGEWGARLDQQAPHEEVVVGWGEGEVPVIE